MDDRSTFRGLIKHKAAMIVVLRYDFSKITCNNQHEQLDSISTSVRNLLHVEFLHDGRDEQVYHFNMIRCCFD
jgi:hypothetical protein